MIITHHRSVIFSTHGGDELHLSANALLPAIVNKPKCQVFRTQLQILAGGGERNKLKRQNPRVSKQALGAETSDTKKAEAGRHFVGSIITDIPGGSSCCPRNLNLQMIIQQTQLHAWGDDLKESFEQIAISLFAYETTLDNVELLQKYAVEKGDMLSLLYNYMNEFLYLFSGEGIVCQHIYI